MYVRSICILRLWYVWLVVCGGSMVCGVEVGGMWRELVCGDKCYVGEVAWEVNGMLG